MRRAQVLLVAVMTIPLAGCLLNGKPKTLAGAPAPPQTAAPAPPPAEPLSIPQTHVDLPAPQPLNPDALATAQPVETPPPAQPKPAPPPKPAHANAAPKPSDPQTPAAEPEQPTRPQIQEILSPDEESRLRDSAHGHQAQAAALLAAAKPTTANQRRAEAEIRQFLKQSVEAETAGDMRLADQLAERANILAKELQSGK